MVGQCWQMLEKKDEPKAEAPAKAPEPAKEAVPAS
jgi:hypothetical protein